MVTSVDGWLRSRAAACGRYRRGGAGAAVCFLQAGTAPRRKKQGTATRMGSNVPPGRDINLPVTNPP